MPMTRPHGLPISWDMANVPFSRLASAPILLGIAFIATLFLVAESGYKRMHEASQVISAAEERQALLARYLRLVLDAESAQRGFLLTEDTRYLRNFDPAVRALDPLLDHIVEGLEASEIEGRRGHRAGAPHDDGPEDRRNAGVVAPLRRSRAATPHSRCSTPISGRKR